MKKILVGLVILSSVAVFASVDLKDIRVIRYSDLTSQEAQKYCKSQSNYDSSICLMTRYGAQEYCEKRGLRLPSVVDFAIMTKAYGAYVGAEDCGVSRTCQMITPVNERGFYYNSIGADIRGLLPGYWFHTSSRREGGGSFQFGSHSGFMASSSDKNPGNVACI